jgi:PAS domain S-box-containing protein
VATIAEAIPDFLWMATADGTPIYQNAAWQRYTGLTSERFASVGWNLLAHPDELPRIQAAWEESNRQRRGVELEYRIRRHDGAYRWFLCRTVPVHNASGQLTHWVGLLTDVHDKKVLEAELHQAVRRRDEFLATLAHELRNPLQALRQAHYVVRAPQATPEVRDRMLDVMDRQIALLARFTDGFLDFNTVRWNSMALLPTNVTMQALVQGVADSMEGATRERSLTLSVEVRDPECVLSVDAVRVSQALTNVLANAVKYSPPGGGIELRAWCEDGMAVFDVVDRGCGIEPDRMSQIFELFARAPGAMATAREGFGIGLAVTRHIVLLHGGTIHAHSDGPGCGSRFTLRFPLVTPPRQ